MSDSLLTCYWSRDETAHPDYVPCFDGDGFGPCCRRGDFCLEQNACFTPNTGITYIAGCTDSSYEDGTCPGRTCNRDSNFLALTRCSDDSWACCEGVGQSGLFPSASEDERDDCSCDPDLSIAIADSGDLDAITSLPADRSRDSTTATSMSSSSSSSTTTTSDSSDSTESTESTTLRTETSATSTSDPSETSTSTIPGEPGNTSTGNLTATTQEQQPGLSRGGQIGVGVGVSLGVLIIAAIVAIWFYRRRQSRKNVDPRDYSIAIAQGDVLDQSEKHSPPGNQLPPGPTSYYGNNTLSGQFSDQSKPAPSPASFGSPPPLYDQFDNSHLSNRHLSQVSELQGSELGFNDRGAEHNSGQDRMFR